MKILMLTDTMDIGGAETHLYELSRSLSFMGHKVKILSKGGLTAELLSDTNVDFEDCDLFHRFTTSPISAIKRLALELRSFKPDIVHAHTRRTLLCAQAIQKIIPFPLIFTAHAKFSPAPVKRFFTRPPTHSIAVSNDIKKHFEGRFGAKNMVVIKNGIDTRRFCPSDKQKRQFTIVHVSRLDKDSSLCAELLCKIAPKLYSLFPHVQIHVIGGGNDYPRIACLAESANTSIGKSVVHAVGAKGDVLEYLQNASLFVGVSRAALEAMCVGVPTLICGNEGYFGICNKENFDLCARENFCARGYEKASDGRLLYDVTRLMKQGGESLRQLVKKDFDSYKTTKETEAVYQKAIADHKAHLKYDATLCGYYGFGNLGDELVLSQIKNALGDSRVAFIGAKGEKRIWRASPIRVANAIRSSSAFILGGGSLLQNATSSRSLAYYLFLLRIAKFFGKKTFLIANGIGPITGERAKRCCRRALSNIDYAGFRDEASFNAAKELLPKSTEARLTCDPALFISPAEAVKKRIAVVIRGKDAKSTFTSGLVFALSSFFRAQGLETVFVSVNKKEDESTARRLSSAMPFPSRFVSFTDHKEGARFIGESQIIISSRLHALIIAASSSRPFIALGNDPKLVAFCKECGLESEFFIDTEEADLGKKLLSALNRAQQRKHELEQLLEARVKELKGRANPDIQILKSLSKRGRPD